MNKSFDNLGEAHLYVEGLVRAGVPMQPSRVWSDQFKKNNRNRMFMLLGVKKDAGEFCNRIAPGGKWHVLVDNPGDTHYRAGLLDPVLVTLQHYQASAWYDRYLPYAYGMIKAEHAFKCTGIDFDSINSYFGTCLGFADMILNDNSHFVKEDIALYREVYDQSTTIKSPELPFYEVLAPALVYIGIKAPHLLAKHTEPDNWQWKHVCEVMESMKMTPPVYKKVATRNSHV
jgi:hypothetical protein